MPVKVFIDTNIVIYALGPASAKTPIAIPLFVGTPSISTQVLSETANVASKRLALPLQEVRKLITTLEAGCDTLYSEDMQDGQVIEGRLRIANPFS